MTKNMLLLRKKRQHGLKTTACLWQSKMTRMEYAGSNGRKELKDRTSKEVLKEEVRLAEEVGILQFSAVLLYQLSGKNLKYYANQKGIKIIGDVPIYVALDSSDAWANPEMLQFDEDHTSKGCCRMSAGCIFCDWTAVGESTV